MVVNNKTLAIVKELSESKYWKLTICSSNWKKEEGSWACCPCKVHGLHNRSWWGAIWELVTLWVRNMHNLHPSFLQVYYELTKWLAPRWLDSSVGRALHWHRRGHGFKSCSGLNFFQALISRLLKLCVQLWWSIINSLLSTVNSPGMTRDDLFNTNASIVQTLTEACAK